MTTKMEVFKPVIENKNQRVLEQSAPANENVITLKFLWLPEVKKDSEQLILIKKILMLLNLTT